MYMNDNPAYKANTCTSTFHLQKKPKCTITHLFIPSSPTSTGQFPCYTLAWNRLHTKRGHQAHLLCVVHIKCRCTYPVLTVIYGYKSSWTLTFVSSNGSTSNNPQLLFQQLSLPLHFSLFLQSQDPVNQQTSKIKDIVACVAVSRSQANPKTDTCTCTLCQSSATDAATQTLSQQRW